MTHKSKQLDLAANRLTFVGDTEEEWIEEKQPKSCREKLDRGLNLLSFQNVIVVTVCVDILLVTFLLLIDLQIVQAPPVISASHSVSSIRERRDDSTVEAALESEMDQPGKDARLQEAEGIMHIIQIAVLAVFVFEIFLRVIAKGVDLIYDKWQVFDSLVVLVTFALYIALAVAIPSRRVTYGVGYVIALRLWRIGRIHYDMTQCVVRKARRIIIAHRKAWKQADQELKHAQTKIERQQSDIESYQRELQILRKCAKYSPAMYSTRSQATVSEDTVTSDDEFDRDCHQMETVVHMEYASTLPGYRRRGTNGSLPSPTPGGSLGSYTQASQPGTPRSLSSYRLSPKGALNSLGSSVGSSGKIPDLVEHTQSADLNRDPSFCHPKMVHPGSEKGSGVENPKESFIQNKEDVDNDGDDSAICADHISIGVKDGLVGNGQTDQSPRESLTNSNTQSDNNQGARIGAMNPDRTDSSASCVVSMSSQNDTSQSQGTSKKKKVPTATLR